MPSLQLSAQRQEDKGWRWYGDLLVLQQPANRDTTGPGLCGEAEVLCRAAVTEPLPAAARCPMLRPPPSTAPPLGRDTDFHPHIVQGNGRSGEVDTQKFLSFMGDALTLNNLYI